MSRRETLEEIYYRIHREDREEQERRAPIESVVDAIDAYIDAKLAYEKSDPEWRNGDLVRSTRDALFYALEGLGVTKRCGQ